MGRSEFVMVDLGLGRVVMADLIAHARRDVPHEACGILVRDRAGLQVVPLRNASPRPTDRFEIDGSELAEALRGFRPLLGLRRRRDLVAYYHSHPAGDLRPTPPDLEQPGTFILVTPQGGVLAYEVLGG